MSSQGYTPTTEQIALSFQRKRRKLGDTSKKILDDKKDKGAILQRRWLTAESLHTGYQWQQLRVMTWNMLAQCLVLSNPGRELFPTSNCLKAHERESMLHREILSSAADIICLQEVDRLEKLIPVLESAKYSHTFACGPLKKHGCLIAYRAESFEKTGETTVLYDEADVRSDGDKTTRKNSSFRTKNIALLVALRRIHPSEERVIVATTHLFWHPRYNYERARQALVLTRAVQTFQEQMDCEQWPCIIAGDFNFAPNDPAYSLVVGDALLPQQEAELSNSRVIHVSIDPTASTASKNPSDDDGGVENDPDKVIVNARLSTAEDRLLEIPELVEMFGACRPLRSLYDQWTLADARVTYGSRVSVDPHRRGRHEPIFTSYTHYWKTVLDYIFVVDPPGRSGKVVGLLEPPREEQLTPGLPQTGICGSDHISLMASVAWPLDVSST